MVSTAQLYDSANAGWRRSDPVLLSDYTARPFLLDWVGPIEGQRVLDLGCGEGYVARQLKARGAGHIVGLDVSERMIESAKAREASEQLGIEYSVGDAGNLADLPDASFDLVVAVFLFNYVDRRTMDGIMREVHRVLRPGGRFVFSVPHPSLAFMREEEPPFYFSREDVGYFSGRDRQLEGRIWRRDGASVPVRCVHKTLDDYFGGLRSAGFTELPDTRELSVTDEHVELDPDFFGPLLDVPLHLALRTSKPAGDPS